MKREHALLPGTLRVEVEQTSGGGYIVMAAGDIDRFTVAGLVESLERVIGTVPPSIVLDLSGCSFVDSSGLNALLDADRALRASGSRLELVASAVVSRTLRATGLEAHFPIRASRPEARDEDNGEGTKPVEVGFPPGAR